MTAAELPPASTAFTDATAAAVERLPSRLSSSRSGRPVQLREARRRSSTEITMMWANADGPDCHRARRPAPGGASGRTTRAGRARRALGGTRAHVRVQFLAAAMLLGGLGGAFGIAFGVFATAAYALTKGWLVVVPPLAWGGGLAAALAIGALSGLVPAQRAAALAPTEALRTA